MSRRWIGAAALLGCLLLGGCGKKDETPVGPDGKPGNTTGAAPKSSGPGAGQTGGETSEAKLDFSTPTNAATSFAKAVDNGDAEGARAASFGSDQARQVMDASIGVAGSVKKFRETVTAKFGEEGKELTQKIAMPELAKQVDEGVLKEEGDTATLTLKNEKNAWKLKKEGSDWKVDLDSVMAEEMKSGKMAEVQLMFIAMSKEIDQLTADVNSGKIKSAADLKQEMDKRGKAG